MKAENLEKDKDYLYWNKSVYEEKPSLKKCTLIRVLANAKFCLVYRYDLTINKVQTVEVSRLKEIPLNCKHRIKVPGSLCLDCGEPVSLPVQRLSLGME